MLAEHWDVLEFGDQTGCPGTCLDGTQKSLKVFLEREATLVMSLEDKLGLGESDGVDGEMGWAATEGFFRIQMPSIRDRAKAIVCAWEGRGFRTWFDE